MNKCNSPLEFGFKTHSCNRYQGLNQDFCFFQRETRLQSKPKPSKRLDSNTIDQAPPDNLNKQKAMEKDKIDLQSTSQVSLTASSDEEEFWIFGVLDGHHMLGEYAAKIAANSFKQSFEQVVHSKAEMTNSVVESFFNKAHNDIISFYDTIPQQYQYPNGREMVTWTLKTKEGTVYYTWEKNERLVEFGVSCVLAILLPQYQEVIIANVGDCQACLISNTHEEPEDLKIGLLATIHNFENKDEVRRVTQNYNTKFTEDGYVCPNHPLFGSYQINMTRALGHKVLSTFGVIPTPTILRVQLDPSLDQYLVLGSDG